MPLYRYLVLSRGKSGQRRVSHHLTNGLLQWQWIESVAENNYLTTLRCFWEKVKMWGKSPRFLMAILRMDKPCELQCHVYFDSKQKRVTRSMYFGTSEGVGRIDK